MYGPADPADVRQVPGLLEVLEALRPTAADRDKVPDRVTVKPNTKFHIGRCGNDVSELTVGSASYPFSWYTVEFSEGEEHWWLDLRCCCCFAFFFRPSNM